MEFYHIQETLLFIVTTVRTSVISILLFIFHKSIQRIEKELGPNSQHGQRFFSSPQRPNQLWDPPSQGHEIDLLPPSSAKVKNAWNHNPTTPQCLHGFCFIKHRDSLTVPEFMLQSDGMHPELILQYCIFGVE
jgi:hypothetical protein